MRYLLLALTLMFGCTGKGRAQERFASPDTEGVAILALDADTVLIGAEVSPDEMTLREQALLVLRDAHGSRPSRLDTSWPILRRAE